VLSFLRKLRRVENRFTRYLLYAIGEIILVVLGILIALQVNNWNEERKLKKQEETILKSIAIEFEENLLTVRQSLNRSDRRGFYCMELLEYVGPEIPEIDKNLSDSLIFLGFLSHVTVELSDAYLNDLLSTGRIHIIKNDSLKYYLSNWHRYVGEVREDERQLFEEKSSILKPFMVKNYSYSHKWFENRFNHHSKFRSDYKSIFQKQEFENLLISKNGQYRLLSRGYRDLEEVIESIIRLSKTSLIDPDA